MSDDLVERLRRLNFHATTEAADRIEELEQALREIEAEGEAADSCSVCREFAHYDDHLDASKLAIIACQALGGDNE